MSPGATAPEVWQEYDCPATGLDFDLLAPHLVKRGDVFHCPGCGGSHTAGVDVSLNVCHDDGSGNLTYVSIDVGDCPA